MNEVTEEEPKRAWIGTWIPRSIWEADGLSWFQKCLWAEISNLNQRDKGCFASNQYLAKNMQSSPQCICNAIVKLRKMKLVKTVGFDGRRRYLKAIDPEQAKLYCGED